MKSFVVRSMTRILLGRNKRTLQPITRTLRRGSAQTLTGKPIRGRAAGAKVVSLALPKEGKRTLGAAQSGRRSGVLIYPRSCIWTSEKTPSTTFVNRDPGLLPPLPFSFEAAYPLGGSVVFVFSGA